LAYWTCVDGEVMRVLVFALVAAAARQLCSRRVAEALCAPRRPRAAVCS